MRNKCLTILLPVLLAGLHAPLPSLGEESEIIYRFDPRLVLEGPRAPAIAADPNVVIVRQENQASMRLQTETQLSPYLDAERGPELSAEEQRLLAEGKKDGGELSDYRLEAGIGLFVEDQASLNLGYRFHTHPSLLDERRNDPLSLTGDVRISFDVKVPF
jgi:hypothetical protein